MPGWHFLSLLPSTVTMKDGGVMEYPLALAVSSSAPAATITAPLTERSERKQHERPIPFVLTDKALAVLGK